MIHTIIIFLAVLSTLSCSIQQVNPAAGINENQLNMLAQKYNLEKVEGLPKGQTLDFESLAAIERFLIQKQNKLLNARGRTSLPEKVSFDLPTSRGGRGPGVE
jgi:hypothetical protein